MSGPDAAPGGDCLCGRGPALGTLAITSTRMLLRSSGGHGEGTVSAPPGVAERI
jgi:hypothetical protein